MAKASTKAKSAETENEESGGKKVIALNTIIRCLRPGENGDPKNNVAAKKPRTQTINAGSIFLVNDTEEDEDGKTEYDRLKETTPPSIRDYTKADADDAKRMTQVVGNYEQEEAVAAASSSNASSGSVKTSANAGTTTHGSSAGGEGSNLI